MNQNQQRLRAALISLFIGIGIMFVKFFVYRLTNSMAILSDALESVVNIVAAAFAFYAIREAQQPPDAEHPYGHGKFEFVTAVFEGGLITFAAFMIAFEAIMALSQKAYGTKDLAYGLIFIFAAGIVNGILGLYLCKMGKKTSSPTLIADGKHVLADFYTSIGMILALGLVKLTGLEWLDPVIAIIMAIFLAYTGIPLIRESIRGLVDAADPTLLAKILNSFESQRQPGIVRAHHLRVMKNGRHIHIDGHLVVPEFWSVEHAHDFTDAFEQRLLRDALPHGGELEFHVDPCRKAYCKICDLSSCTIRIEAFTERTPQGLAEITSPVDITDLPK